MMEVLWAREAATVGEVMEALPLSIPLAYSTVLTTLRILENKGYLRHSKEGRAFVYRATVGREEARQNAVANLLRRFFQDSPELLVLNLVQGNRIDTEELDRLRRRIVGEEP